MNRQGTNNCDLSDAKRQNHHDGVCDSCGRTQLARHVAKLWLLLGVIGPGIFAIGCTIGTGSVTSMAKAGSQYGMQLLWVLALSCLFSRIMACVAIQGLADLF